MSPQRLKHSIRNAASAILVIGGGLLQYAYTSTSHPSTILKVWAWIYGIFGVCVIVGLAILGVEYIKRRRG